MSDAVRDDIEFSEPEEDEVVEMKQGSDTTDAVHEPYKHQEDIEFSEPEEDEVEETKRGRDMSDAEYRDFMVSSFSTLIDLTKQLCRIQVTQKINEARLLLQQKPVAEDENKGPLPEFDTIEKVKELEENLKSSIYQTEWIETIVAQVQSFRILGCNLAARKIMRFIFSTEVLLRMNYAGNSVFSANGVTEDKFKLQNSKLFEALVSIMREIGFKSFKSIKTGILNVVYKSKEFAQPRKPQNIEKSETGSSEQNQHLVDPSEPSVGCFEEVSINPEPTDEVLNTNAEEIPEVAAEEVLNTPEPMEQVLENTEQIHTENSEQVSNSNGEKSLKNPDSTRKTTKQPKPVENNEIPKITTMKELIELEENLNNSSFCKEWMEKVVVRYQALRTLHCSRASRRIMRLIFSTEVLLRMNYAGHSVYVENGTKKNKFKLKNSKLFVALVSIMRKIGFKVFRPIKTGILNVVYKSKDLSLNQYEKSKPVSTKQRMADKSEPLIRHLEKVLMRNAENSKEIENTTEEVLEPMEQVVNNSEQIQTDQEQSANKEKTAEQSVSSRKPSRQCKPVENNEIIQITTMEELKELEKSLNTPSFCKEWMGNVLAKMQLHVDFDPLDCRVAARKMMRSIFTTIMLQRMNYAGYTKYDAGDGRIERKFKLKYSKLFAVLVLIMKKLGFKNFSTVKIEILNLVYKSKPQTRKPENSDSECCEDAQKSSKRCASNIGGGGQVGPEKQAESTGIHTSQPDNFQKLSTIKEARELERQLQRSSYFTKWTDEVASKLELYTSPLCSDVARHMMKLVFDPSMWLKMNFAGRSMYDAGDGYMMDKFKLKHSKLFGALVCVMKKLGFKNFYDNKKAILSIVYKSNPRVPAKLSETQTAIPSKSVTEHSSSSALNSKSKPTKQKVVAEHSRSPDLNSKSKPTKQKVVAEYSSSSDLNSKSKTTKQKVVAEHSRSPDLNSKSKPTKQKVVAEHSSSPDLNSKSKSTKQKVVTEHSSSPDLNSKSKSTKQKVVAEHSSSPEQEDLNSKCAEEILFGNFELATLTCSTANIPIESSTSNVVTDDIIEPDTILSIEQDFIL